MDIRNVGNSDNRDYNHFEGIPHPRSMPRLENSPDFSNIITEITNSISQVHMFEQLVENMDPHNPNYAQAMARLQTAVGALIQLLNSFDTSSGSCIENFMKQTGANQQQAIYAIQYIYAAKSAINQFSPPFSLHDLEVSMDTIMRANSALQGLLQHPPVNPSSPPEPSGSPPKFADFLKYLELMFGTNDSPLVVYEEDLQFLLSGNNASGLPGCPALIDELSTKMKTLLSNLDQYIQNIGPSGWMYNSKEASALLQKMGIPSSQINKVLNNIIDMDNSLKNLLSGLNQGSTSPSYVNSLFIEVLNELDSLKTDAS